MLLLDFHNVQERIAFYKSSPVRYSFLLKYCVYCINKFMEYPKVFLLFFPVIIQYNNADVLAMLNLYCNKLVLRHEEIAGDLSKSLGIDSDIQNDPSYKSTLLSPKYIEDNVLLLYDILNLFDLYHNIAVAIVESEKKADIVMPDFILIENVTLDELLSCFSDGAELKQKCSFTLTYTKNTAS